MKKLGSIAAVCVALLAFTSCEKAKDWNCKCTYKEAGVDKVRNNVINDRKEKDAKALCTTNLVNGPDVTDANCILEN